MKLNSYVWSLYRDSADGRKAISRAFPRFIRTGKEYGAIASHLQLNPPIPVWPEVAEDFKRKSAPTFFISLRQLLAQALENLPSQEKVEDGFRLMVNEGVFLEWDDTDQPDKKLYGGIGGQGFELDVSDSIAAISTFLHWRYPEWFIPYYFSHRFDQFAEICATFDILLPPIPGKAQKAARALYYLTINRVLQEFRDAQGLSAKELIAFLYDFAPRYLSVEEDDDLPPPQRAWFVMAGVGTQEDFEFLDNATAASRSYWRGHRDARRGDIAVVWCASPRAQLHSIWRVEDDGFDDPFAHWYSLIKIGRPIKILPLKLGDMKAHPVLSASPMVRAHFQGSSGQYFRDADYQALLELFASKGFEDTHLPRLAAVEEDCDHKVMNERDVEIRLIEPLLKRLGYTESDWTRQLRLRMGRGDRVFPDYVVGASLAVGQERGNLVVESKYRIATQKELREAWIQGRSYALRLEAKYLMLAALEGIWLLSAKDGFRMEAAKSLRWAELNQPDAFFHVEHAIGKKSLHKGTAK